MAFYRNTMKVGFKRVPALDKCFSIRGYPSAEKRSSPMSELAEKPNFNKNLVFKTLHTLTDLSFLENKETIRRIENQF